VIRRQIGRWGRSQEFDLTQVRDLRAAGMFFHPWSFKASLFFWGIGGGNIAFDYGAKTYRFGASLEEAEARQLVKTIKERFPIPEDK
jgi:hypothetical protein